MTVHPERPSSAPEATSSRQRRRRPDVTSSHQRQIATSTSSTAPNVAGDEDLLIVDIPTSSAEPGGSNLLTTNETTTTGTLSSMVTSTGSSNRRTFAQLQRDMPLATSLLTTSTSGSQKQPETIDLSISPVGRSDATADLAQSDSSRQQPIRIEDPVATPTSSSGALNQNIETTTLRLSHPAQRLTYDVNHREFICKQCNYKSTNVNDFRFHICFFSMVEITLATLAMSSEIFDWRV